ncbi:hypothetical protein BDQ17DRAFT_1434157 [Cyathus striatus]|nr:hypothetical protein BDQ17DRAFT_1434157 [Cyathus striatus]
MSTPPSTNGALVDIRGTYGALLIGAITSASWNYDTAAWFYHITFPKDRRSLKLLVAFVWSLEFLRACLATHAVYYYTVLEWGNVKALENIVWSVASTLLTTHCVEVVVHFWFAYRVWIMSKRNKFVVSLICFFTFCNFVLGFSTWLTSLLSSSFSSIRLDTTATLAKTALSCAIATDWTIAISLIYYLNEHRTGFTGTNMLINRLIFYAINIGLLTSVTDIVVLVLNTVHFKARNLYYLAMFQVVGNLYANSFLASLNSRASIRDKKAHDVHMSTFAAASYSPRDIDAGATHRSQTVVVGSVTGKSTSDIAKFAEDL